MNDHLADNITNRVLRDITQSEEESLAELATLYDANTLGLEFKCFPRYITEQGQPVDSNKVHLNVSSHYKAVWLKPGCCELNSETKEIFENIYSAIFESYLSKELGEGQFDAFVLDARKIKHMFSAGVGLLASMHDRCSRHNVQLWIYGPCPHFQTTLAAVQLDHVVRVAYPDKLAMTAPSND